MPDTLALGEVGKWCPGWTWRRLFLLRVEASAPNFQQPLFVRELEAQQKALASLAETLFAFRFSSWNFPPKPPLTELMGVLVWVTERSPLPTALLEAERLGAVLRHDRWSLANGGLRKGEASNVGG